MSDNEKEDKVMEEEVEDKSMDESKDEVAEKEAPSSPKKGTKRKAAPSPARKSKRAVKAVQHFVPVEQKKKVVEYNFQDGEGERLGDIENVEKRLSSYLNGHVACFNLHKFCYPDYRRKPKQANVKKEIRNFSGYWAEDKEAHNELVSSAIKKLTIPALKDTCGILDIPSQGSKSDIITRIIEFLWKPEASGNEYQGKRKKGKKSKKKKATGPKKKRAPSTFILFSTATRPKIKEEMPELDFGGVAAELSKRWAAISDEEKQKFQDKHDELAAELEANPVFVEKKKSTKKKSTKKKSTKKKKAPAKKKKAKKPESSDEEEESSESEEEGSLLTAKFTKSIKKILKGADLDTLTSKSVRKQMIPEFGADVIKSNKDHIKELIAELC